MRFSWIVLSILVGCGNDAPPAPPSPSEPSSKTDGAKPRQTAENGPVEAPVEARFEAPGVGPIPEGRVPAGYPAVAVQGFGLRLELHPPFQATRMKGLYGTEDADVLVVSWWDVAHPDAGKHGRVGLYNVGLIPGRVQPEGTEFEPVAELERGKRVVRSLRLGAEGSRLRFPEGHNALGGMARLEAGPAEEKWTVQVGDQPPVDFAERGVMLHSWDPASGSPIHFDRKISQPYGDWPPQSPPVDGATGSATPKPKPADAAP